ncbi:MAG: hypothetical protein ACOH1Q_04925 [Thiobacillus sp.]
MSFFYGFMDWLGWGSHGGSDDDLVTTDDQHQNCCCEINPANGLSMIGGCGGVDVEGNPYGFDFHHNDTWTISLSEDDPFPSYPSDWPD